MPKSIARQAFLSVCDVAIQGISLLLLYAFLIRTLSIPELGVWAIVSSGAAVGRAWDLGLGRGLIRYVPQQSSEPVRVAQLFDSAVAGSILVIIPVVMMAALALWLGLPLAFSERLADAMDLVPWALGLLAAMLMSNVYVSGLTALFRSDLRAAISIAGVVLMVALAVFLVPQYRIPGLAAAQIAQHLFVGAASLVALMKVSPKLRPFPMHTNWPDMRDIGIYGLKLQGANIAIVAFEPAARVILGRFGSLDSVVYYDMASRLVQQIRNVIVMANQVMSPYFAAGQGEGDEGLAETYRASLLATIFFAAPSMAALVVCAPLVSSFWIGNIQGEFIIFMSLLAAGWFANVVSAPAYFVGISRGILTPIVVSHLIISLVTVGLGLGLGYYLLGEGVVVAVSTALLAGALYCSTMIQRELRVESPMFDSVDKLYLAVCFVAAVGALGLHSALDNAVWIPSLAGLVLLAWAFRLHPRFRTMTRFIPETVTGTQDK